MNWEALGAMGEIVGVTAVVVSLIYLALQIRANALVVRYEAMRVGHLYHGDDRCVI